MTLKQTLILSVIAVFSVMCISFVARIMRPRVVIYVEAPNGAQFCVFQDRTGPDYFYTSAYSKLPGEKWGWFYFEHDDALWLGGRTALDPLAKAVLIYRSEKLIGKYFWEDDTFQLATRNEASPPDYSRNVPKQVTELGNER